MTLFLNEHDVEKLLTVQNSIDVVEKAILDHGRDSAKNFSRNIVKTEKVGLSVLQASVPSIDRVGFKTYTTCPEGVRFWVMLFSGTEGSLDAIIEAEHLSMIRTGAASGVATKYLSREDSRTVGILGTGYQAAAQLEAVCAVRPIETVYAWSRTFDNARAFAERMGEKLGIDVLPVATAEEAVAQGDIVITITSSKKPVLFGDWLRPGTHVNMAGAMKPTSREIDDRALQRATLITVDDWTQAHKEAGELIEGTAAGVIGWDDVKELGKVIAGDEPARRTPEDITLFKSHGVGIWDVAAGQRTLELARASGIGIELPIQQAARQLGKGLDPSRLLP